MRSHEPKRMYQPRNHRPDNPTSRPRVLPVVLEPGADNLANLPMGVRNHYTNRAVKAMRLFLEQMEALRKYRGGGMQQVIVKHVQVNDGGRAIVGHIEAGRPEGRV